MLSLWFSDVLGVGVLSLSFSLFFKAQIAENSSYEHDFKLVKYYEKRCSIATDDCYVSDCFSIAGERETQKQVNFYR